MKYLIGFGFFLIMSMSSYSQKINDSLLILHARVITADSSLPLHNAHIISKFNHWGTISNENGEFKMLVSHNDSVMITTIGFSPLVIRIDSAEISKEAPFDIVMRKDTVLINEIVIHTFWDYRTFKQLIVNMEPLNLDNFYPDWEGTELLYKDPHPLTIKGPIQALFDVFNKNAQLSRRLIKNRSEYNKLMIQMGHPNDTIPPYPEHMMGGN